MIVILTVASGSTAGIAYYYQARTMDLRSQVSTLTSNANSLSEHISALKNQVENLTRQISQLQTTQIQLNQTYLQLQSFTSQLASANAQLLSLETQLSNEITKVQSLESQFTTQLTSLQNQLAQSQAEVASLQAQITQLQAQLANSTGLCSSGKTITIGELTDLSSALSTQGMRAKDGSLLAINDINSFISSGGCSLRFAVTVDDYALDNSRALSDLQSLTASGIQVVVGPLNSGAAQYILQYADSNHVVLISPSSSSPALSIPDDYLFRTSPNDAAQGPADARMLVDRGASAVIIVQRHDTYGDALANATATRFKALGGTVIDSIRYDTSTADFTAVLSTLNADWSNNVPSRYAANKVAIDVVAFEEFGQMIIQAHNGYASAFPWSTLPWFGTDGEAQDAVIVNAATSGPYVSQVVLPSTLYLPANNSKTIALDTTFASEYPGNFCDLFCLGAYDDVWLAALATLQAGSYNGTRIQSIMVTVASDYYGVTGWTGLEPNGDRLPQTYQIWKVVNQGSPSTPTWILAGAWDALPDTITWTSPP